MTIEELEEIVDKETPDAEAGCERSQSLVINALAELANFDKCSDCGCHVEEGELRTPDWFDSPDWAICGGCYDALDWGMLDPLA